MFSNILFLIIILLLVSFAPMANGNTWIHSPAAAFGIGMLTFAVLLGVIALQNKLLKNTVRRHKQVLLAIVNFDLLAFLVFYHFILSAQRFFPASTGLISLFSLCLYFLGLYVFYSTAYPYLPHSTKGAVGSGSEYAAAQLRLTVPFTIPFLLFSFLIDAASLFPELGIAPAMNQQAESLEGLLILFAISAVFLIGMMLFFPPLIQYMWKCRPIRDSKLKARLDAICNKAGFRHAGMKTWTILNHSYTAGIIGIIPRFRYVMFTKRLLHELSEEAVEAVLAHEIGHSYRKHLLIYPLIILGMIVSTALFSLFFSEAIYEYFALQELLRPSPVWDVLYPLCLFVPYALIIALYFRYVFGYFSRLFERQADLHVYEVGLPPESMHLALDELGMLTGNTHHLPSWHHHSIGARMRFLERTAEDRSLVEKHHRRVRKNLYVYTAVLTIGCCLTVSPLMPDVAPFRQMTAFSRQASALISDRLSRGLHRQIVDRHMETYGLEGDIVREVLLRNVEDYSSLAPEGAVEYLAAKDLYEKGMYPTSAKLMSGAWRSMNAELARPDVLEEFSLLTGKIITEYKGPETEDLQRAYREAQHQWGQQ